ncbi:MFS transporter [Geodermatophilus sp. SYSU D00700]
MPSLPNRPTGAVRLGSAPWLLMAAVAVVGAQSLLLAPLFVDVARSLGTGPAAVGRAAGAYGLATAVSALALGRTADRLPRRTVLRAAAAVLSAGLLLSATAQHWVWLAAGQAVAGAAAGVLLPAAYATAGELAPASAQTRAVGRVLLGWSVAMVVAVPLAAAAGGAVGWRGTLAGVAALSLVLVGLLGRLPEPRAPREGGSGTGYAAALRRPGVRPLLLVVLAYMGAFYATYAYLGHHLRAEEGASAAQAGLLALAYGAGFGAAGLLDARVDRVGPARLLLPAVLVLAAVYGLVPLTTGSLATVLLLAVAWGLANHLGLSLLVGLLSRAGGPARGPVLSLYSAVTYLAASLGTAGLGPAYEHSGLPVVALVSALALLLAAVPAARVRAGGGEDLPQPVRSRRGCGPGGRRW